VALSEPEVTWGLQSILSNNTPGDYRVYGIVTQLGTTEYIE